MKEQDKWYIKVDGKKIEVSEEIYRAYWHYTEKERYFSETLKNGKFISCQEHETAQFTPSREDSLERLESCGIEFPDVSTPAPDDIATQNENIRLLKQALELLPSEEQRLVLDYYYLERTEREIAELLHTAASTIHSRKQAILKKLKKYLEKNM